MSSAPDAANIQGHTVAAQYVRLGTGDEQDRLNFRLVVGLLTRCLTLLGPVKWHVVGLMTGFAISAAITLPATLFLFDLLWNKALMGTPLTLDAAQQWNLPPAVWVNVDVLPDQMRRESARFGMMIGAGQSLKSASKRSALVSLRGLQLLRARAAFFR